MRSGETRLLTTSLLFTGQFLFFVTPLAVVKPEVCCKALPLFSFMPVLCSSLATGALVTPGVGPLPMPSQECAVSTRTLPSFWAVAAKRCLVLLLAQVTPPSRSSEQSVGMDVPPSGTSPVGLPGRCSFWKRSTWHLVACSVCCMDLVFAKSLRRRQARLSGQRAAHLIRREWLHVLPAARLALWGPRPGGSGCGSCFGAQFPTCPFREALTVPLLRNPSGV